MTTETWKDIPEFEGRYQVSDLGRVRNPQGVLRPQLINSGYFVVHLYADGARKAALVHRLVALGFVDGHFEGAHVNHKNADKQHNIATNLEWVTRSQNMLHASTAGLMRPPRYAVRGVAVLDGHVVCFESQLAAEKTLTGRASSAIHHCLIGKKKSAYGYRWERA